MSKQLFFWFNFFFGLIFQVFFLDFFWKRNEILLKTRQAKRSR